MLFEFGESLSSRIRRLFCSPSSGLVANYSVARKRRGRGLARPFSIKEIARPAAAAAADADVWSGLDVPRDPFKGKFCRLRPQPSHISSGFTKNITLTGTERVSQHRKRQGVVAYCYFFCYLHLAMCRVQVLSTKAPVNKGRLLFADEGRSRRIQHPGATKKRRRTKRWPPALPFPAQVNIEILFSFSLGETLRFDSFLQKQYRVNVLRKRCTFLRKQEQTLFNDLRH